VEEFKTFRAGSNFPLRVGVMADLGLSFNSSDTATNMYRSNPDVVLNIGDLPYAGRGGCGLCVSRGQEG
jgi:hypothetical protein